MCIIGVDAPAISWQKSILCACGQFRRDIEEGKCTEAVVTAALGAVGGSHWFSSSRVSSGEHCTASLSSCILHTDRRPIDDTFNCIHGRLSPATLHGVHCRTRSLAKYARNPVCSLQAVRYVGTTNSCQAQTQNASMWSLAYTFASMKWLETPCQTAQIHRIFN